MKTLLMLIMLLGSLAAYSSDCDYDLNLSNATIQVTTDTQVVEQPFTIRRRNTSHGNCTEYRMFFSKGLANSYQRKAFLLFLFSLNYNLHSNINQNGILKGFNDALSSQEFVSGTMPQNNTWYGGNFYVSVPAVSTQSWSASGIYQDTVQVSVYGYNPNSGNYFFETVDSFTLNFIVNKKIDVSVVDEGGAFDASSTSKVVDFGLLEQNAERGADIMVVSNTPYQIKLSSMNNGTLKLGSNTINYQLRANGNTINLTSSQASPVTIATGSATNSSGARYNIKMKITENVDNKQAGLYQDVITITAIAN